MNEETNILTIKMPKSGKEQQGAEEVGLPSGKPVVIIGSNGSGKTTLAIEIEKLNDAFFSKFANKKNGYMDYINRLIRDRDLETINTFKTYLPKLEKQPPNSDG